MIGNELGHYRIEGKLGEGGMGVVYKARDTHLDRAVAIKVLSAEAMSDPERKRRFVQEARTASSLNHPNILHIYDIDQSDGIDFMAMEFVEGKTLDQLRAQSSLPAGDVLNYACQMAGALARAHDAGIVHRDIKPANIMVTPQGLVKVLDFGLAKLTESTPDIGDTDMTRTVQPQTEPGMVFGTIQYMSPEQAEGKRIDGRSDIFSLGAVLYELLTGRRPFKGDSKLAILAAVLNKDPTPIAEIRQDVPPEVDQIVNRCLQKEPERRYASMNDLKAALEEVREALRTPTAAVSARVRGTSTPPPRAGRKWLWGGAAVALAAMLAVGIWFLRRANPSDNGKLIAVLPFQTASGDAVSQASAAGLTELLGRALTHLNQFQSAVRILPPADAHGDAARGPGEARRKLGAALALTGQVGTDGINVALLDTNSLREVKHFSVKQPDLLKQIVQALELRTPAGGASLPVADNVVLQGYGELQNPDRIESVDRAIALFQQALVRDPASGLAHAGMAEAFWAKSELTHEKQWAIQAGENCRLALAGGADSPEVHLVSGKIASAGGNNQAAVEEFRKALRLDPDSIPAHTNLGEAYEALGQIGDSEAAYKELVQRWPNYLVPYSHLASFYFRQGRYPEAVTAFRKVTELAPENANGYQNLGAVYHLLGRTDDAAAMMKKSLSLKPTASGYTNLGTLYFFQGRYSDAVPLMEKAVEMDPDNYVYRGNLGDAYRWASEYSDRAPDAYRQAIKLAEQQPNRNDADLRASLAAYYAKLADTAKSMAEIAQARRLAPMNPKVLFKAALVYEMAGRRDQALGALDLALQGGYSIEEVRREPALAQLRKDSRYERLDSRVFPEAGHGQTH